MELTEQQCVMMYLLISLSFINVVDKAMWILISFFFFVIVVVVVVYI